MLRPWIPIVIAVIVAGAAKSADAQVTATQKLSAAPNRVATLEDQLVSRLRATNNQQKAYIKYLVKLVEEEKLEAKLVLAIERKAIRRNRYFPFPYFERAMRFEAEKRDVLLPLVQRFATTRVLPDAAR